MLIFCKKMLTSAKLMGFWYRNLHFSKLIMRVYVRTKFQVSSVILTSFRQGVVLPPVQHKANP